MDLEEVSEAVHAGREAAAAEAGDGDDDQDVLR